MPPEELRQLVSKEMYRLGIAGSKVSAILKLIMWAYQVGLESKDSVKGSNIGKDK